MTLKRITAPADEPLSLAEVRLHLRLDSDYTTEDAALSAMIADARLRAEHETGRSLVSQTWEVVIDAFPCAEIELPRPDVAEIVSVTYIDAAGATQTIDPANYTLDNDQPPGWVLPAAGYSWPATMDTANAVRVRFLCGYGGASDVPAGIRSWMLLHIGTLYRNRETFVQGSATELPNRFVDRGLDPYRTYL